MTVAALGALALWIYAYAGYPAVLWLVASLRRPRPPIAPPRTLPMVTITVPVYNEAEVIAETLEAILAVDYPAALRQVLVISDASSDGTDAIVRSFASRGVELVRLSERRGKTAAENAVRMRLRGEIVVNTDASVRVHPAAVRALVAALADPSVGVASARDVSIVHQRQGANPGEGAYVGYEMWVRALETRVSGIVGASGCLYAIRAVLHREELPDGLSRDFASALVARLHGYRAVSVRDAVCYVPRAASLRREYRRKVRTMTRGLATLFHERRLLNPVRYGAFAWMLASHKLCRWLLPWASVAMLGVLAALLPRVVGTGGALAIAAGLMAVAVGAWRWAASGRAPRLVALPAYAVAGLVAGLHAWVLLLLGTRAAVWEPTRRRAAAER